MRMRGTKTISKFEADVIIVKQGLEVEVEHIRNRILQRLGRPVFYQATVGE